MSILLDEVRQTRDAMRYGFAVGKVRVLETRALDRSALERLLDARGYAEQKRLLTETAYARYLEHTETPEQVEAALDDALSGFYRFIEEAALPSSVVRFFRLRHDYANLKAVLKARVLGASLDGLLVEHGTVPAAAFTHDPAELPGALGVLAAELAAETDVASVDAAVDRAYFRELTEAAHATRNRFLIDLAKLMVDSANVKTLVRGMLAGMGAERLAELFLEGGSVSTRELRELSGERIDELAPEFWRFAALRPLATADLTDPKALDPMLDALMAAALRAGRREAAGPEPVIAYVMGREAEVRILRVLLVGTLTGISLETLRSRLSVAIG